MDTKERIKSGVSALRESLRMQEPLDHPDHDEIAAYVDDTLSSVDCEIIDTHLELCPTCAEDVEDLRSVQSSVPKAAPIYVEKRRWYAVAAVAAAAATVAVIFLWMGRNAPVPAGTPPALSADILTSVQGLNPDERERIEAAVRTGRINIPPFVIELRGKTGTLLGNSTTAPSFSPVRPMGTAVESTQPLFEWTPLPAATSYVVSVFDSNLDKVAESGPLQGTRWTPAQALRRGQDYIWQVRAQTTAGDVIAPTPPAPEARFRILDQAAADRVAALRGRVSGSSLALGILLANEGLLDDAEDYLNEFASSNPSSQEVRQLLASVRAGRQR